MKELIRGQESVHDERQEFKSRVGAAFDAYKHERLTILRGRRAELVSSGWFTEDTVDQYFEEENRRLDGFDTGGRITAMLNNFHMWWPTGWYRELLKSDSPENARRGEQLMHDLDEYLQREGYIEQAEKVVARHPSVDKMTQLEMLFNAYVYMKEKGYSTTELTA